MNILLDFLVKKGTRFLYDSDFGLSPGHMNYLTTSPLTKANQIEPVLGELSPGLIS